MKTPVIAVLMFALGAGVGWIVVKRPVVSASHEDERGTRPAMGVGLSSSPAEGDRAAGRRRMEEILRARHESPHDEFRLPDLTPDEYAGVLDAFRHRAGLTGLSWDERSLFGKVLGAWHGKDPEAAADWVRGLELREDRMNLGEVLVAAAAKADFDEAVRLMKEFSVNEEGVVKVPESMLNRAAQMGAGKLVELLALSDGKGGSTGFSIRYPGDFDYRQALDGIADLGESGIRLSTYPTNLLSEWARRDPEAALRWAASGRGVPMDLDEYFRNLESAERMIDAISIIASSEDGGYRLYLRMGYSVEQERQGELREALAQLPEDVDQFAVRTGLLRATNYQGARQASLREDLLAGLTSQERATAMRALFGEGGSAWNRESRASLRETLVKLGHEEQEAEELVPRLPDPTR